tara:strand:- start:740 stop:1012 length:273 start_codon:yes stop_codon:yes gene_type:complete
MKRKKATYNQMMQYLDQTNINLENNQKAVYDLSQVITDYIEMRGKSDALNDYMKNKHLGSSAQIETRWSSFFKAIKNKYLQAKKILAFKK